MEKKLKVTIEDIKNHIKWEQKFIDRFTKDIKEYTKTCTPENMAMFLPSKIRELENSINRREKYTEQLNMLQFIQEKN